MKNITLSVDEATYRAARKAAAAADSSVSGLVRTYLRSLAGCSTGQNPAVEEASRKRLVQLLKKCKLSLDGRPTRESFYTDRRFH